MLQWVERQHRRVTWTLIALNVLFPLFLALWAHFVEAVDWEDVWEVFEGEKNAITWFSSVQLLFIALLCYLTFTATHLLDGRSGRRTPYRELWRWMALAFVVLSCDENFMYHEQLRERLLKPHGWFTHVPKLKAGDIGLFIYLFVALSMLYFIWQMLRSRRSSVILFASGIALIIPLVILDGFEIQFFWDHETLWNQYTIVEEVGEPWCELLFALAIAGILFDRLRMLCRSPAPDG